MRASAVTAVRSHSHVGRSTSAFNEQRSEAGDEQGADDGEHVADGDSEQDGDEDGEGAADLAEDRIKLIND